MLNPDDESATKATSDIVDALTGSKKNVVALKEDPAYTKVKLSTDTPSANPKAPVSYSSIRLLYA